MEQVQDNNIVKMGGVVASELELSHEIYGEKFYRFYIEVNRLSDQKDKLPVIISERLIDTEDFNIGKVIFLEGQYRSYNKVIDGTKSKLILSIFVKEIEQLDVDENVKTVNELTLVGSICKPPIYRKTPLGRDIADVILAVNRAYNKSDYIPCILWGRNAKFCQTLETGANVKVVGRIQARQYEKKYEDGTSEIKVAYEVSVSKFETVDIGQVRVYEKETEAEETEQEVKEEN